MARQGGPGFPLAGGGGRGRGQGGGLALRAARPRAGGRLARQRQPHNAARYFYIDEFYADARGPAEEFPQFALIEPDYMSFGENDDHPPHDVMRAEKLIADVYNSLRENETLWKSTLLVVVFDEHCNRV